MIFLLVPFIFSVPRFEAIFLEHVASFFSVFSFLYTKKVEILLAATIRAVAKYESHTSA